MNETILADTPLENPEEDRLGYAPFARNLANALCSVTTDDSLVFALYGPWGSGKTTCLNFILRYIEEKPEDQRPIIVRFNPWWFSGHGELLNQFFREFQVVLGKEKRLKKVASLLADFSEFLSEAPEPTGLWKFGGKILSSLLRRIGREKEAWVARQEIRDYLKKR